jgi:hypothetical protein
MKLKTNEESWFSDYDDGDHWLVRVRCACAQLGKRDQASLPLIKIDNLISVSLF